MDAALKQRMVGALVLIALAVIFIPMILEGPPADSITSRDLEIPPRPDSRVIPVNPERARRASTNRPAGQSSEREPAQEQEEEPPADPASLPAVDVATADPATPVPEEVAPAPIEAATEEAEAPAVVAREEEPDPATQDAAGWVVQVGSFRDQGNAVELVAALRQAEFPARLEAVSSGNGTMHRIRVGPYASESEARDYRARIKDGFPQLTPSVLSSAQASGGRTDAVKTWVVQAGSFGERANADALRDRLRTGGFAAFVEPVGSSYRVRVGPELTRERAERVRGEIQSRFDIRGIVVSYR